MELSMPQSAAAQFEGLHPSLPITTRFCIVGGGPSGLAAAYALVKLGYENVTVLEKYHSVAGMCESVEVEGFTYDLGGQVVAKDSAPTIMALANEMNMEMEDMSKHKLALIDCSNKTYQDLNVEKDYISVMPMTLKLQAEAQESGKLGMHAVSSLASEVSDVFVCKNAGLRNGVPRSVSMGYTASGYGFVQDMPFAYLHEFTRTSMFGKIRRVKTGYTSLWRRIAKRLPCVRCSSEVVGIDRKSCGVINVVVKAKRDSGAVEEEELQFDRLIISGALPYIGRSSTYRSSSRVPPTAQNRRKIMNFSAEEDELFSKVRTIEYYTTVLKISGLNLPQGFYYCKTYVEDPSSVGHPVAIQRFHAETDIYLFWSYGNSEVDQEHMTKLLYEDVRSMGGKIEDFILQRKWDYFPHVNSAEMQAGFYDRLEDLQGKNNTLYVGGLLAFELTERNSAYSMNAIAKHFASPTDNVQYIKKLFELPLQIESKPYSVEELLELPGVDFPDLPNLDAYLRFWANHPVVRDRILYTWLNEEGSETDTLTYSDLHRQASVIAQKVLTLKPSVKAGDRVLLIYPPGFQFIVTFFGCLRARVLPVPLIPPDPAQRPGQALAKVEKVAAITDAKLILSTISYHRAVNLGSLRNSFSKRASTLRWPNLPWHCTDSWIGNNSSNGRSLITRVFSKIDNALSPRTSPWSPKSSANEEPTSDHSMRSDFPLLNKRAAFEDSDAEDCDEEEIEMKAPEPGEVCFLQFTSGSTGDAKGVMITHDGLIHNVKLMRSVYKSTSQTVLVSWLPQYHDMGLIGGLFTAMVSGGKAILFSPITFIRKPLLWLDTMTRYNATHSAGPNFAFELLVRRCRMEESAGRRPTYNLSSLRFLMISAEPIRHKTVKNFVQLLQASGLKEQTLAPGYGLAENCVFVCCAWGDGKPILVDWQGRVCCGYVREGDKDVDIRIANPETGEEATEGEEGELWVSSPSSGIGYWGQPAEGEEVFNNKLKSTTGTEHKMSDRSYVRTGDLGRVIGGKLFVTGRLKDLIIVQGRNVYPADVEKTVEDCCDAVRPGCCAVFGAPQTTLESMGISSSYSSEGVGIVVVAELRDGRRDVDSDLIDKIKDAVAEEHGLEVSFVSLIKPRTISKTSSGKIKRFECLQQFSDGSLHVVADSRSCPSSPMPTPPSHGPSRSLNTTPMPPLCLPKSNSFHSHRPPPSPSSPPLIHRPSKPDIERFLIGLVSQKVGIPAAQISSSQNLASYGLTSTVVVWAAHKLSEFLGTHVAAIDIYTAESISELADVALALTTKAAASSVDFRQQQLQQASPNNTSLLPSRMEVEKFVIGLVIEKTGVARKDISVTRPLTCYGLNSTGVVFAAQKLSSFLGIHVAAIDIYTCNSIADLVDFAESLLKKAHPREQEFSTSKQCRSSGLIVDARQALEDEIVSETDMEAGLRPSVIRQIAMTALQLVGMLYAAAILLLPAAAMCKLVVRAGAPGTAASLTLAVSLVPVAALLYTVAVGTTIAVLAVPFLQPNYARDPWIPLWTVAFVKWWTLYRLQDFASNSVALGLRGTVFMSWWYRAMGARIGAGVVVDTTDITDPGCLRVGSEAMLAEGATLQGHVVDGGVLRLSTVSIGSKSWVGPFSLVGPGARLMPRAQLGALQMADSGTSTPQGKQQVVADYKVVISLALRQLIGLYLVLLTLAVSAAVAYPTFLWLGTNIFWIPKDSLFPSSFLSFKAACLFFPLVATFPWPVAVVALVAFGDNLDLLFKTLVDLVTQGNIVSLATCFVGTYVTYGVTLTITTCALKWCLIGKLEPKEEITLSSTLGFRMWLVHRLISSTHVKFTMFLSGTEALCMYLRAMGANVGYMASIRGVNPLVDPDLLNLSEHSHLGDFAKIITTMLTPKGTFYSQKVTIGDKSVVGAQSVVLPRSTLEKEVILGAMSVAPMGCVLREGGVYVGVENPIMVNRQLLDMASKVSKSEDSTHQMEPSYQRIITQLAAHIAITTLKVNARYFHRIGVVGKGTMRVMDKLPMGFPDHDIFSPGKMFHVIIRHSNSLSSDDDARGDARGAALRILGSDEDTNVEDALVDLTLKSGKAFYARTISDFVGWLMGSREQRIEVVKREPHVAEAVWTSLRKPNSYSELHYYSNTCCLFRSTTLGSIDHYVRFCLRPANPQFGEDEGRVVPQGILPPDTGMLPRDANDNRPHLFLADDFRTKILSSEGVRYLLQLQLHPIDSSFEDNEVVLDCSKPWDERIYPFQDVALIHLDELLESKIAESLQFDPMNKTRSLDMVYAKSASESGSVEHGRYLAYAIAQHLRNGLPLQDEWRSMLNQTEIGVQLLEGLPQNHLLPTKPTYRTGCPALSGSAMYNGKFDANELHNMIHNRLVEKSSQENELGTNGTSHERVPSQQDGILQTEEKESSQFLKLAIIRGIQPLVQTVVPVIFLMVVIYPSVLLLSFVGAKRGQEWMFAIMPTTYLFAGFLFSMLSIACRWALIGRTHHGDSSELWGSKSLCDTTWQAVHALLCVCFLELTRGSLLCVMYFKCLGAEIGMSGVYMDSLHVLNPDLLKLGAGSSIGRNCLMFGHLYEGGRVVFKKIEVGEGSFVGTRALLLPGLKMEASAKLGPLGLGMKDEVVACY